MSLINNLVLRSFGKPGTTMRLRLVAISMLILPMPLNCLPPLFLTLFLFLEKAL